MNIRSFTAIAASLLLGACAATAPAPTDNTASAATSGTAAVAATTDGGIDLKELAKKARELGYSVEHQGRQRI
jgi:outer membrane biogenesis lipoprotein LolB